MNTNTYINYTIKICEELANNCKKERNRYRQLLLGEKSNKVLQSFLKVLPPYFPTIKFIYFDTDTSPLLDRILNWLYDNGFHDTKTFPIKIEEDDTLEKHLYIMSVLERINIKLFIILDNFERVYTSILDKDQSQYHVEHVCTIINSLHGNIQLIVTGDSVLEKLCYFSTDIDMNKYPNYCSQDLNCTKLNLFKLF